MCYRLFGLLQSKHDRGRRRGRYHVVELSGELLPQLGLLDTGARAKPVARSVPVRFDKHRTAGRLSVRLRVGGGNERFGKPNDDGVRIPWQQSGRVSFRISIITVTCEFPVFIFVRNFRFIFFFRLQRIF